MKLIDMDMNKFAEVLASSEPAPGGGSVSAYSGTLGAALIKMVISVSKDKEKFQEHAALYTEIFAKCDQLQTELAKDVDRDTEAFNGVSAVFKMPKETDEDKAKRKEAMQAALKQATIVPFEVLQKATETLLLAEKLIGVYNENAASDFGVCALQLNACVQGAYFNVKINLSGVKDTEFVSKYEKESVDLLNAAVKSSEKIIGTVLAML